MRSLILFTISALLLTSCVGNRQVVLLQDKAEKGSFRKFEDAKINEQEQTYRLSSSDILYIRMEKFNIGENLLSISGIQQQNMRFQVDHPYLLGYTIGPNGTLEHPTFGTVQAAGKSMEELGAELDAIAEEQFPGSSVEIFLINGTVTVIGEVQRAGRYPIFKDRNTLLDVIAMAGDFQTYADRRSVKVIRANSGVSEIVHLDLTDINTLNSKYYHLENDDIIVIAPLKRKKFATTNIQWLVSSITALVAVSSIVITLTRP